jgi:hypothetical protein
MKDESTKRRIAEIDPSYRGWHTTIEAEFGYLDIVEAQGIEEKLDLLQEKLDEVIRRINEL